MQFPSWGEYLYSSLLAKGLNVGTIHHVRRTLNKALNDAVKRGRLSRNPVSLANTPRYDPPEVDPLTVAEARTLLASTPDGSTFDANLSSARGSTGAPTPTDAPTGERIAQSGPGEDSCSPS